MRRFFKSYVHLIDTINRRLAQYGAYLVLVIMAIGSLEVFLRNLFNSPTIWAWEFSSMLLVIYIAIAGGYTMLMDGHIRMDLFYERFSPRKQAVIDIVFVFLFFFYMGMLTWHLSTIAGDSFSIKEHSFSAWAPPLYPIKILLPIATFMTLLQGVAKLIRDFNTILGYEAL